MIRPATDADIAAFYGQPQVPVRMIVMDNDGVTGIGGLAWCDDGVFAVSWLTEKAKQYPREVLRAAMLVREMIEDVAEPVYANADQDEPTADAFLRHIGFRQEEGRYVYRVALG